MEKAWRPLTQRMRTEVTNKPLSTDKAENVPYLCVNAV